jgi:hypothetical protein
MITIKPATLRDATYVIANMRPMDRKEVYCQLTDGVDDMQVAYLLLMHSEAYAARWTDQSGREWPVMFFGTQPMNAAALGIWALGTRHARRSVPAVTRYVVQELLPRKIAEGYRIMEARSIEGHTQAHRWIVGTGAKQIGEPFEYGKDGELFHLFRWTVDTYRDLHGMRYDDTSAEQETAI